METDFSRYQEFLDFVIAGILGDASSVSLKPKVDERGILFELLVKEADMGKFIGKGGKTVKSIRVLLRAMGAKNGQAVTLKIIEPKE